MCVCCVWIYVCLHVCTCTPPYPQYYTHSLQPHSTGFSTSCVNEVPSSHSKVSRRRRILKGAQQEVAVAPGSVPAWHRPRHSTQEKGLDVWQRTVPRCRRWKSLTCSPRQVDSVSGNARGRFRDNQEKMFLFVTFCN